MDGQSVSIHWIDLEKFLDQSILLYLRFNGLNKNKFSALFYAWTMFSVDYVDFDQLYIMLKILAPP